MHEASTDQERVVLNARFLFIIISFQRGEGSVFEKQKVHWQESAMN